MIKTPKISDVTTNLVNGLTLVGGGLVSRGAVSYIPEKHQTIGKAGVAVGATIAAAAIKGNSTGANAGKLALMGVAAMQLIDLVTSTAKKNIKPTGVAFVDKSLGLAGCGCQNNGLGQAAPLPFLSMPAATVNSGLEQIAWSEEEQYTNFEEVGRPLFVS